jgi:hypothetical protein
MIPQRQNYLATNLSPFYTALKGSTRHAKESPDWALGDCFGKARETTVKRTQWSLLLSHIESVRFIPNLGSTRHVKESPKGVPTTVQSM